MKKVIILIALITLPVITFGQNASNDTAKQNDIIEMVATTTETIKQTLSTSAKAEVNDLNYKKSIELISIKAYRKSLQIKVKEIKTC